MAGKSSSDPATGRLRPASVEGQVCSRCVMDTSDPEILFDENGVCSHCYSYDRRLREDLPPGDRQAYLERLLGRVRSCGKNKPYDCIIGVSGGIDSTYVAWLCKKQFGLRPLAVHFDNGWNTELAVQNIQATLHTLNIDLYTHVVDWEEFRDIQLSFLKSSISDWELPTDHAIRAILYHEASRRGIKFIITGSNLATEAVMPSSWGAVNIDLRLLRAIQRQFGSHKLKTFPQLSLARLGWYTFVRGIRQIPILNYVEYSKSDVTTLLERELSWRPYAFKHGESLFTRFFQRYYLPSKFGFDKRKPHLANLILSGQMTREEALQEMNAPLYYPEDLVQDKSYVAKKLGLTSADLEQLLQLPPRADNDYPNSAWVQQRLPRIVAFAKRVATDRRFQIKPDEKADQRGPS
jgi:N-acetyl sugar amidotransferase